MVTLSIVAFISGALTILAPCIWPLLPIVLSDVSQSHSRRRPLGITVGVSLSFAFFTLSISLLETSLGLNPNALRFFAVITLVIVGITMIIPAAAATLEARLSRLTGRIGSFGQKRGSDFRAGLVTGVALGIVWAPCSGPILASIATLAATNKVSLELVIITLFYVAGAAIPLFGFALGGQKILTKSRRLSKHTGKIQVVAGVLLLITALAIYTNYDKTIEARLLNAIPSYSKFLTKFESTQSVTQELSKLKGKNTKSTTLTSDATSLFNVNDPAPELVGISKWLNTESPLTLKSLRGKVVLVDFWTYTCINCIRTLPHVTTWYDKYKSQGLVVIGVHTPEFAFEKDTGNVLAAIKRFNIHYPVAQDNSYSTWSAFNNQYWPAEYLIDAQGRIRREEFGEGNYQQTEMAIQKLLKESGKSVNTGLAQLPDQTPDRAISPETYLGSARMLYHYPINSVGDGTTTFPLQKTIPIDHFSYGGKWTIKDDFGTAVQGSTLAYHFGAHQVFIILRPPAPGVIAQVQVFLNGKLFTSGAVGSDVINGKLTVDSDRLYNIFDSKREFAEGVITLKFLTSGVQAYTYTFG